jgi:hypothetical protein
VEGRDLLRPDARHGRRPLLGEASGDRDLGPSRALPVPDALRDRPRESFGAHARNAGDGVARGVGDDLLEARLVHRLPRGGGLHEAVQPGRERLRRALVRSEADHRLDALQADAGQGDAGELRPSPRPHGRATRPRVAWW